MGNKNNRSWLFKNITIMTTFFILIIMLTSISTVYYWSFYHFSKIFEDRIIDENTLKNNKELGVENEWILGVSTDSIDVLEAIHGEKVVDKINESALSQEEITKLYREKIGDKNLIYMVDIDTENGEHIYKYSVIKDIYKEIFPRIAFSFLVFAILLFMISYGYSKSLSNNLYNNIKLLVEYTRKVAHSSSFKPIAIKTQDSMIAELGEAFNDMKKSLIEKENLQQTSLEYISHEMKTPIMIIESYANSAKNEIFPKGDLNSSLDTIIKQSKRMEDTINTLMKVVKLNSLPKDSSDYKDINLGEFINKVVVDLSGLFKDKELILKIDDNVRINAIPSEMIILLENLIENQIKYSERIIAIRLLAKADQAILLFYNDGDKIEKSIKRDIFKPFVKGSKGTNGLGLSICKTIANQHNGDIELISTKEGVLFKVSLKS